MGFLEAAHQVLAEAGEPLHYREINKRALAAGLVSTKGSTPWETMNARMAHDIKKRGAASPFMRTKPGVFALRAWGLEREREPDLKARVAHLPTWRALRGFLQAVAGRPRQDLTALRVAIRRLKGENLDFTQPDQWINEHLEGPAAALGISIWTASNNTLNPRYVAHCASVANRYDLLEEDHYGTLQLTKEGRDFLKKKGGDAELRLDTAEGVVRVLAIVAEHGPDRSSTLMSPYMEWCRKHTGTRAEATGRVSLHARLQNLIERALVQRSGHTYGITAEGMGWLGREPDALVDDDDGEDKDEVFDLVREVNEQQTRVRQRIREALYTMDPYAFEHLVKRLLEEMGYQDVEVTKASSDKGVDVVGSIEVGITPVKEVIQAKRQKANVGRPVLDALRGSLYRWSAQRGTIITTSSFSNGARGAAFDLGAAPIQLIDGDRLVGLLVDYGIGVKKQPVNLWRFDPEPFTSPQYDGNEDDENDESRVEADDE